MNLHEAIQQKIDLKTKPIGALGELEKLALKIAIVQKTKEPKLTKPTLLVFAADHGLSEEGVSPFPKEVTAQMVFNFLSGGAAINVFCQQNQMELKIIDAGVDYNFVDIPGLIDAKMGPGTQNMLYEPAMTLDKVFLALQKGKELIDDLNEGGCNTVGFGEMGIGNTSSAALLMHKICKFPIENCVGRGTGLDDAGLRRKIDILSKVLSVHTNTENPEELLATFGGFEIAMITGAMLRAWEKEMIILIDGFIATSALLVAHAMKPEILGNCVFCHQSDEQGHKLMLEYLKARPLLKLGMRLGEGTGCALAMPIIQASVNFLNQMASFESAGVSNKE